MPFINAIAPWFGGKRTLASRIVAELGEHKSYWEPFCGSAAVLFGKPRAPYETINDLHLDLTNLARVLADESLAVKLHKRVRRTLFAQGLAEEATAVIRDQRAPLRAGGDLDRAYSYLVHCWFGRNGVAGTATTNAGFCQRYSPNGGAPAKRWESVGRSILWWHRRLKGVTITNIDGFTVLDRLAGLTTRQLDQTAVYVDPPYLAKGARYQHDFADHDHDRLAGMLHCLNGARVVVSYYDHPRLSELYPGWTKVNYDVSKAMAHMGGRGAANVRANEVLLINGPSLTQTDEDSLFANGEVR